MSVLLSKEIGRVLILVFFAGIYIGCIPTQETFFTPSAESGETIRSTCNGNAGTPNVVVFTHPVVRIRVSSNLEKQSVTVTLGAKGNASIFVPANQFSIKTRSTSEPLILSQLTMYQYPRSSKGGVKVKHLLVEEQLMLHGDKSTVFHLIFPVNVGQAREFTLKSPTIQVNGKDISIPPITWALSTDWIIWPINC